MVKSRRNTVFNIFLHQYKPFVGGIEIYVENFSRVLLEQGYAVNIITSAGAGEDFVEKCKNLSIFRLKSIKILDRRFPIPISFLQIKKLYKYCFKHDDIVTIVNTRFFLTSILGLLLGKISKSRLVVLDHGSGHLSYKNSIINFISHIYEHAITAFIKVLSPEFYGVSESCSGWLTHFGITASGVIHNGVNFGNKVGTSSFSSLVSKSKKIIFYAGRLIPEKGIVELVEAFIRFSQKKSGYVLVLAGTGSLESYLVDMTQKYKNIFMLGKINQKDVFYFLSRSCIFINPSNYPEGLPTVLLEAGAFSLPVISTPNGGAKEIIINGGTGIIIPTGDVKNILTALTWMSNNKTTSTQMGVNLYKKLKREYGWNNIVKKFLVKINNEKN